MALELGGRADKAGNRYELMCIIDELLNLVNETKDSVVCLLYTSIYNTNKKRRGRSRYLLSVMVDVVKDGEIIPAKVVYVRNRNKRKEYLCLISTDVNLDENEIIRIYGKRWDIEVFFKVCKSYLTAKSMKYTNKARNKVFRFVHLNEHAKHDTSDSRKETVQ